jgi:hypothetical protein
MDKVQKLAHHEIGWWKAHHRRQYDILTFEMTQLYSLLFNISGNLAKEAVDYRVEAAKLHDLAERYEDSGNMVKADEYWSHAEQALKSHYSILLKSMKIEK